MKICAAFVSAPLTKISGARLSERATAKLLGVELPVGIATHDAADHHQHTRVFDLVDQCAEGLSPSAKLPAFLEIKIDKPTNITCQLPSGRVSIVAEPIKATASMPSSSAYSLYQSCRAWHR